MPNPSGPDRDDAPNADPAPEATDPAAEETQPVEPDEQATESYPVSSTDAEDNDGADPETEAATEVLDTGAGAATEAFATGAGVEPQHQPTPERRFTAPGFDAGATEVIHSVPEPTTEVFQTSAPPPAPPPRKAAPQLIPPRLARKLPSSTAHSWGWVLALILIILALAAIAVLGTVWLTRGHSSKVSQEDQVRDTIHNFDIAVQNGDLTTLRTITCGTARDGYVNYNDQAWNDTYRRVAAAKRYPVVASIDQVAVHGDHAEANVTAFMAYAPQVRSTRSFDLQFRDDQWKICQSPTG
ncbi:hypothetical protein E2F47_09330 [Mycobacterium eburneum]|nr:hypothetical protein [Mycobacterium eburneum]TDH55909.1 hypothetical protein E2F47_09330 [Mycobacterium eburneum]